jgi:ATP-dependent Clp protease ATP-binding subunit ClpC
MFGDPDALIQVDMSEYMEKFNVSRLVGSPPGYVGHGEGGELTERIRRRPYSVVLFDEIEKAHPDVMHMLLQILEEGKITDTLGRKIDFRNTVIIMTSNLGAEQIMKGGGLGFGGGNPEQNFEKIRDQLIDMAKKRFKPEFINRLDEVVVFRRLTQDDLRAIVRLEIDKVKSRMRDQGFDLLYDEAVTDFIIEKGGQPEYGARPLRRAIERNIEDEVAEAVLRGFLRDHSKVRIKIDNNKLLVFPEDEEEAVAPPPSSQAEKPKGGRVKKEKPIEPNVS